MKMEERQIEKGKPKMLNEMKNIKRTNIARMLNWKVKMGGNYDFSSQ